MSTKISETIERECCKFKDLLPYRGITPKKATTRWVKGLTFCHHCGQIWCKSSEPDGAGGSQACVEKVQIVF